MFDRALPSQIETLCPLQFILLSLFLVLSNGLRPCCTATLPRGSLCTLRGTSQKFLLAYRVHDGVSEAKTMAVTPFNRETSPWRHGGDKVRRITQSSWSRQNWDLVWFLSLCWSPSSSFQRPSGSCPLGDSAGDSPGWDGFLSSVWEPGFPGSRGTRKGKVSGAFDPSAKIMLCLFN